MAIIQLQGCVQSCRAGLQGLSGGRSHRQETWHPDCSDPPDQPETFPKASFLTPELELTEMGLFTTKLADRGSASSIPFRLLFSFSVDVCLLELSKCIICFIYFFPVQCASKYFCIIKANLRCHRILLLCLGEKSRDAQHFIQCLFQV